MGLRFVVPSDRRRRSTKGGNKEYDDKEYDRAGHRREALGVTGQGQGLGVAHGAVSRFQHNAVPARLRGSDDARIVSGDATSCVSPGCAKP